MFEQNFWLKMQQLLVRIKVTMRLLQLKETLTTSETSKKVSENKVSLK